MDKRDKALVVTLLADALVESEAELQKEFSNDPLLGGAEKMKRRKEVYRAVIKLALEGRDL